MADRKLDVTPQEPAEEIGEETTAQPDTAANDSTPSGRTARM